MIARSIGGLTLTTRRHRRRGFSIVEMLTALAITGLMLGIAMVNLKGSRGRSDARAAAEILSSSLRQARQAAIAENCAQAIAIPTGNGVHSHGHGFYRLIGETRPKVREIKDFTREFAPQAIFGGRYDGPSWETTLPPSLSADGFVLADWLSPFPQDLMVVFLPNGTAVSNLPLGNGAYRLVVAASFSYSGAPATLTAAQDPSTVSVTPSGEITIEAGIPLATTVAIQNGDRGQGGLVPAPTNAANQLPQLVAPFIEIDPVQNAQALAQLTGAGTTVTIPLNGMVNFSVHARDPDGDALWCNWTGPGTFSSAQGSKMVWDEERKLWVGQWSWRVPPTAAPGDTFNLTCQVYDNRGGITVPTDVGLAMPKAEAIVNQSILAAMSDGLYRWNWDGTNATRLLDATEVGGEITLCRWSPDFTRIAFASGKNLYLISPDGQNLRQIHAGGGNLDGFCWSRDGLKLYFLEADKLHEILAVEGSTASAITGALGLSQPHSLAIHPTELVLLTSDESDGKLLSIWLPESPGGLKVERVEVWTDDESHNPVFSPNGTDMYFRCREKSDTGLCYFRTSCTVDPTDQKFTFGTTQTLLQNSAAGSNPFMSPDGEFVGGGMNADGLSISILPTSNPIPANIINVTPIEVNTDRCVNDADWGVY